ncbi:MAG: hypothetical protein JWN15_108 [Firmicutes bacterium]|nr:hypothetical protein [Bacillota bacterium]
MVRVTSLGGSPFAVGNRVDKGPVIVACATLVESHVDRVIKHLFEVSGGINHEVSRKLYDEVRDSIYKSWPARHKWLARAFDVKITGEKFTQDFILVVGLRNSIVHGGGSLTPIQISRIPDMVILKKGFKKTLDVECIGRTVILGDETVQCAIRACRDYLIGFDAAVTDSHPEFDI